MLAVTPSARGRSRAPSVRPWQAELLAAAAPARLVAANFSVGGRTPAACAVGRPSTAAGTAALPPRLARRSPFDWPRVRWRTAPLSRGGCGTVRRGGAAEAAERRGTRGGWRQDLRGLVGRLRKVGDLLVEFEQLQVGDVAHVVVVDRLHQVTEHLESLALPGDQRVGLGDAPGGCPRVGSPSPARCSAVDDLAHRASNNAASARRRTAAPRRARAPRRPCPRLLVPFSLFEGSRQRTWSGSTPRGTGDGEPLEVPLLDVVRRAVGDHPPPRPRGSSPAGPRRSPAGVRMAARAARSSASSCRGRPCATSAFFCSTVFLPLDGRVHHRASISTSSAVHHPAHHAGGEERISSSSKAIEAALPESMAARRPRNWLSMRRLSVALELDVQATEAGPSSASLARAITPPEAQYLL